MQRKGNISETRVITLPPHAFVDSTRALASIMPLQSQNQKASAAGQRSLPIPSPRVFDADAVRDQALEFACLRAEDQPPGADDVGDGLHVGCGEIGGGHGDKSFHNVPRSYMDTRWGSF